MALPFSMFAHIHFDVCTFQIGTDIDPSVHYVDFNKRLDGKFYSNKCIGSC